MKYLAMCLLIISLEVLAAEESVPVIVSDENPATATSDAIQTEPAAEPTDPDVAAAAAKPTDTLGGSGLKNRQLGDIFEQFVPTETISADNAVPFPVDI